MVLDLHSKSDQFGLYKILQIISMHPILATLLDDLG